MIRSLHSDEIYRREFGSPFTNTSFPDSQKYSLTVKFIQKSFPASYKGSSTVWVGSRENLIFTLESKGRVVMYNTLSNNPAATIINSPVHGLKCVLSSENLVVISKTQDSPFLTFSSYQITDLQSGMVLGRKILGQLNLTLSDIHEINERDLLISLVNSSTFQVWSLQSSSLHCSFPYNPDLTFQYTNSRLVFWQKELNQTSIGIVQNNKMRTLALNSTNDIYLCEIINDSLVIGMKSCHLQIIDLNDFSVEIIKKGVPSQVFRLNRQDAVLAVYNNGTVIKIQNDIKEFCVEGKNFVCGESEDLIVLASNDGKIYVNWKKIDLKLDGKGPCQVGVNPDTHQIIFTEKGKISVFE